MEPIWETALHPILPNSFPDICTPLLSTPTLDFMLMQLSIFSSCRRRCKEQERSSDSTCSGEQQVGNFHNQRSRRSMYSLFSSSSTICYHSGVTRLLLCSSSRDGSMRGTMNGLVHTYYTFKYGMQDAMCAVSQACLSSTELVDGTDQYQAIKSIAAFCKIAFP